jgi:hypothetical protein
MGSSSDAQVDVDVKAKAALTASMAAHLPELGEDKLEKLVAFAFAQEIHSLQAFEHLRPESFDLIPIHVLSLGLRSALAKYVKAMCKPAATVGSSGTAGERLAISLSGGTYAHQDVVGVHPKLRLMMERDQQFMWQRICPNWRCISKPSMWLNALVDNDMRFLFVVAVLCAAVGTVLLAIVGSETPLPGFPNANWPGTLGVIAIFIAFILVVVEWFLARTTGVGLEIVQHRTQVEGTRNLVTSIFTNISLIAALVFTVVAPTFSELAEAGKEGSMSEDEVPQTWITAGACAMVASLWCNTYSLCGCVFVLMKVQPMSDGEVLAFVYDNPGVLGAIIFTVGLGFISLIWGLCFIIRIHMGAAYFGGIVVPMQVCIIMFLHMWSLISSWKPHNLEEICNLKQFPSTGPEEIDRDSRILPTSENQVMRNRIDRVDTSGSAACEIKI